MLVVPSPKFQFQPVALVEVSATCTVSGTVPVVGVAVKFAFGSADVTVIVLDVVLLPPAFPTVSFTV